MRSTFLAAAVVLAVAPGALRAQQMTVIHSPVNPAIVFEKFVDAMTDEDNSDVLLRDTTADVSLAWKCVDHGQNPALLIVHGHLIGDLHEQVSVQTRLDDEPASAPEMWFLVGAHTLTQAPLESSIELTRRMMNAHRVRLRIVDSSDNETVDFAANLEGLKNELVRLPCLIPVVKPPAARH